MLKAICLSCCHYDLPLAFFSTHDVFRYAVMNDLFFFADKVVIDDIITPPPPPPTTPASNIKSTSPSSTVSAFTVQTPAGASNKSTAKENASTAEENASTAEENVVAQGTQKINYLKR